LYLAGIQLDEEHLMGNVLLKSHLRSLFLYKG